MISPWDPMPFGLLAACVEFLAEEDAMHRGFGMKNHVRAPRLLFPTTPRIKQFISQESLQGTTENESSTDPFLEPLGVPRPLIIPSWNP